METSLIPSSGAGVTHPPPPPRRDYQALLPHIYASKSVDFRQNKVDNSIVEQALACFGNPHTGLKAIHVTGSNGKGSVSFKIARGLQSVGHKVGWFSSPHITDYRERFRINGKMMSIPACEKILNKVLATLNERNIQLGFFELTTVVGFLYFSQEEVDYAVIEVGIGGALDPTNVLPSCELAVITSIGLEHTDMLGDTVEKIAREKAGIIKPYRPVIVGPHAPLTVIQEAARKNGSDLTAVEGKNHETFEEENRRVAHQALLALGLKPEQIEQVIERSPPCRFEHWTRERLKALHPALPSLPEHLVFDAAHNPPAFERLITQINTTFPQMKIAALLGMASNKDIAANLNQLRRLPELTVYPLPVANPRLTTPQELADQCRQAGIATHLVSTVQDCLNEASKNAQVVLVCGSFFVMGPVREGFGIKDQN